MNNVELDEQHVKRLVEQREPEIDVKVEETKPAVFEMGKNISLVVNVVSVAVVVAERVIIVVQKRESVQVTKKQEL